MADTEDKPTATSAWTRVGTLIAAVNPILLAVIGYFLNANIEQAKVEIERAKVEIEANSRKLQDLHVAAETSAITNRTRVDKVKVISDFINDLTGPDERRRQLAIEAVFIALPDDAARLVKAVERFSGQNDKVTERDVTAARSALDYTRTRLISDMFSDNRATRIETLHALQRGWADDAILMALLVERAMQDVKARAAAGWPERPRAQPAEQQWASLSNAAEFLAGARIPADPKLRASLGEFAAAAAPNSDDTKRFTAALQEKLR